MSRAKSEADYLLVRDHVLDIIKQGAPPLGRLPTERDLAEDLAVGRGVTRRVLGEFEAQGLISRHVGRGTFIGPDRNAGASPRDSGTPEKNGLASQERTASGLSPAQYLEARLRFEPELAWLIVANATAADLDHINDLLRRSEKVGTSADFEASDREFHAALVAATHNTLVIDMYQVIDGVRRRQHGEWLRLHGDEQMAHRRDQFSKEHSEIVEALMRRDGRAARDAWSNHIRNTKKRITDY